MSTHEIATHALADTPGASMLGPRADDARAAVHEAISFNERRWLKFLIGWSLLAGCVYLGLFVMFSIVSPLSQGSLLTPEYDELVWAINGPVLYRAAITADVLAWLMLGGFLLAWSAVFAQHMPIRSVLIAACGVGQVAGLIGAFTRLHGTTSLSARYLAAVPEQQADLLRSFLDLQQAINAHFAAGSLLWSAGLLLVATMAWSAAYVPRPLASIIGLTGAVNLTGDILGLVTSEPLPFALFILPLMLLMSSMFAVAAVLWRRVRFVGPELAAMSSRSNRSRGDDRSPA